MVKVLFADLSRTIDITHGQVGEDMSLRDVLNCFAKEWSVKNITISGRPITDADLKKSAKELAPEAWKNFTLQIEKHG